jgi:alanine-alpha-ketoisovalerate/valine-pyruvate aminotransferase
MKELEVKLYAWIRDHLIPQLVNIFHKTCSFNNIEFTVSRPNNSFYMSDLFYVNILFPGDEKRVLVKLAPENLEKRSLQNYNYLFSNEILFYERLAKSAIKHYPKYYLGSCTIIMLPYTYTY